MLYQRSDLMLRIEFLIESEQFALTGFKDYKILCLVIFLYRLN